MRGPVRLSLAGSLAVSRRSSLGAQMAQAQIKGACRLNDPEPEIVIDDTIPDKK